MQLLRGTIAGLAGLLSLQTAAAAPAPTPAKEVRQSETVTNVVIFSPPTDAGWVDPRVLYARAVQLSDGGLLATWENYSPEPPLVHFPIYRSDDGGASWEEIGRVEDTVNDWGLRYQPELYQLPSAVGRYPAGTLVLAGNSIPTDLSKTKIDIYVSEDGGVTWAFTSSVATGGEARPENGLTPVWEPFFVFHDGELICFYSDQRDPKYGQKLTHQVTTDLESWSEQVDDVRDESNYDSRPGMPTLAELPDGRWIFAYEICGGSGGCRVFYRLADDPRNVLAAPEIALQSTAGTRPVSSPFVVWSSVGGDNGSIVLSSGTNQQLFINRNLGDAGSWEEFDVPQPKAYSRGLTLLDDDSQLIIIGGGSLPPSSTNQVSLSVVDLAATIGA